MRHRHDEPAVRHEPDADPCRSAGSSLVRRMAAPCAPAARRRCPTSCSLSRRCSQWCFAEGPARTAPAKLFDARPGEARRALDRPRQRGFASISSATPYDPSRALATSALPPTHRRCWSSTTKAKLRALLASTSAATASRCAGRTTPPPLLSHDRRGEPPAAAILDINMPGETASRWRAGCAGASAGRAWSCPTTDGEVGRPDRRPRARRRRLTCPSLRAA